MDAAQEAARLMESEEPVGKHALPIGSYIREAIDIEMVRANRRKSVTENYNAARKRAAARAESLATQWGLNPDVFRAALEERR